MLKVLKNNKSYDYLIVLRPDVLIKNDIDVNFVKLDFDIIIPNTDHHEGYNDRFAILPFENCEKYTCRIDEIIEFRKTKGRIVSEKYVKFIIEKYYKKCLFMNFIMTITRPT